jgi:outer membrane protein OmpA-like peptidoglycan-associated protein
MNDQPDAGTTTAPATEKRLVTRRRRVRRPLGGAFWATSLVLVAALAAATVITQREPAEQALQTAVRDALRERGGADVGVAVRGRSVTVRVPAGANEQRVVRLAGQVPGVVAVESAPAFADAEQRRTCARLAEELDSATNDQRIPFVGESAQLSAEGTALVRAAAQVLTTCPLGDVVVGGHTDDDTDGGGALSLERARVIVRALEAAGVDGGRLEPRGYGDQFPVDDADTDAARQANQRGSISARSE